LQRVLQSDGYHVLAVVDGVAALAAAGLHLPDLIITHYPLPLIDGPALCRRLRAEAGLRHIPIVVVTPFDDADSRHEIMAAGATRIVSASWSTTRGMVTCLDRLVARSRQRRDWSVAILAVCLLALTTGPLRSTAPRTNRAAGPWVGLSRPENPGRRLVVTSTSSADTVH
jgi:CheY-like chemotaxis protein